jgi:DNA-binding response OmpR family regulator
VNTLGILIVTDEPIFSFGLRVQFQKWGFGRVEIAQTCDLGLRSLREQATSLIILDEKFTAVQQYGILESIAGLMSIPIILLSPLTDCAGSTATNRNINLLHTYLSKPCQIEDLRVAVQHLLHIQVFEA